MNLEDKYKNMELNELLIIFRKKKQNLKSICDEIDLVKSKIKELKNNI